MSKTCARARPAPPIVPVSSGSLEQSDDAVGQRAHVSIRDEEPLLPVLDHLGQAADAMSRRRLPEGERFDQRDRQTFVLRGQREHIERRATRGASSRNPVKIDGIVKPQLVRQPPKLRLRADPGRPGRTGHRGHRLRTSTAARNSWSSRLCVLRFATVPTTGASVAIPNSSRIPLRSGPSLDRVQIDPVVQRLHRRHPAAASTRGYRIDARTWSETAKT